MNIVDLIKPGDCVDFGDHGYVIGENRKGTAFLITDEESDRTSPNVSGWFIPKSCAKWVIEVFED